ncbi:MAG: outer membrane protein assembly factor BamD [Burkholderiaceae bacterium]|nr:outer membrane protein assembly factor BamD [Burkholderiaceae bacterium]
MITSILRRPLALALVALTMLIAACQTGREPDHTIGWTPDRLYAEAKDELSSGNYGEAIKYLQKLESRYPFGRWAQQAQLELIYAQYKDNERAQALAAADRFIRLHPNHPALDYVHYMKGLVNFNDQSGLLANLGGQDLSERDLAAARDAFDSFRVVIQQYPESRYAGDARDRMAYLVNAMAAGEVHIARYYFERGAYIAAANRAQSAVRQYQQTPAIEEALYIMYRAYDELGMDELRDNAKRVLLANFPDSAFMENGLPRENRRWWQVWR